MTGLRTVGGAVGVPLSCLDADGATWRPLTAYTKRTNLLTNPSFRSGASTVTVRTNLSSNPRALTGNGWRANNTASHTMTYDTTFGRSGTTSAMSTPSSSVIGLGRSLGSIYNVGGDTITAAAGAVYTVSTYVAHNAAVPGEAQVQYLFRDNANTTLGQGTSPWITGIPGDKSWTRVSFTTTAAPAGTTKIVPIAVVQTQAGTRNVAAGEYCWFTDSLIELAGGELPYFDGSTPTDPATGWTYSWRGAANASNSDCIATVSATGNLTGYQTNKGGRSLPGDVLRLVQVGATNASLWAFQGTPDIPVVEGEYFTARWQVRRVSGSTSVIVSPRLGYYGASFMAYAGVSANVTLPNDGSWVDVAVPATNPAPAGAISVRLMCYSGSTTATGTTLEFRRCLTEKVPQATATTGPYFDGSTAPDADFTYSWTGTADSSTSTANP